jgi:hypothetical protein
MELVSYYLNYVLIDNVVATRYNHLCPACCDIKILLRVYSLYSAISVVICMVNETWRMQCQVHALAQHSFKICFNIIFPSVSKPPNNSMYATCHPPWDIHLTTNQSTPKTKWRNNVKYYVYLLQFHTNPSSNLNPVCVVNNIVLYLG